MNGMFAFDWKNLNNQKLMNNIFKKEIPFYIVLIIAILFRMYIWFDFLEKPEMFFMPDTKSYLFLGINLMDNFSFPSFSRTPIYPFFLGIINVFFPNNAAVAALFQVVISIVTLILLYVIVKRLFCHNISILFALFLALDFQSSLTANFLLSETLFTFILSFLIFRVLSIYIRIKKELFTISVLSQLGILLSILSMCRPIAILLCVPISLWMFLTSNIKNSRNISLVIYFCLISLMFPLLWSARNYIHTNEFFFSTISSKNIFEYRAAWNISYIKNRPFEEVKEIFKGIAQEKKKNDNLNEGEIANWEKSEGIKILFKYPLITIYQGIKGLAEMYLDYSSYQNFRTKNSGLAPLLMMILRLLHMALLYIGVLSTCYLVIKNKFSIEQKESITLLIIIAAYFTFFSVGAEAYGRFRVPIVPALSIISAVGLIEFVKNICFFKSVSKGYHIRVP